MSIFYYLLVLCLVRQTWQKIIVENSGLVKISANQNAMFFFIQIRDSGPTSSRICVEPFECCEIVAPDETDCTTIRLFGGDMDMAPIGVSRNVTLFFPTLYGYNRQGTCLVDILYNANTNKLRHRLDFDSVLRNGIISDALDFAYDPDKILPCQTLDLDPFNSCQPVNCIAKYYGQRNYFNRISNRCEKAVICSERMIYLPDRNSCIDIEEQVTNLDVTSIVEELPISDVDDTEPDIICNKGRYEVGACICDPGWTSNPSEDHSSTNSLQYCNAPCGNFIRNTSLAIYRAMNLIMTLVIVVFLLLAIVVANSLYMRKINFDDYYYNPSSKINYYRIDKKGNESGF